MFVGAVSIVLAAQATQAMLVGMVRDAGTGAPLAGAVVALTDLDRATTTDRDGRYVLGSVPAGPHHVSVRFIGYSPRALHALVPREGRLEVNVALQSAPVQLQPVDVHALTAVSGAFAGELAAYPDRDISISAVWNNPLLAEPDALQALGGGEVVLRPEAPSGLHVRGGAPDHTAYLVDGVPVFSPYHSAGMFSAWNPDALSRLQLSSAAPSPALPSSLSGAVEASTRAPGRMFRAQGAVTTTQARLTVDGPMGATGAGYLVSVRSGYPGILAPKAELSYVRGSTGDVLAKLEGPVLGGLLRLLGYAGVNDVDAAAADTVITPGAGRNLFKWNSRSLGAEWRRPYRDAMLRVLAWGAVGTASSAWAAQAGPVDMASDRHDVGVLLGFERHGANTASTLGLRLERSRTAYAISSESASGPSGSLGGRTTLATAFAQHTRAVHARVTLVAALALPVTGGELYAGPRVQLRWQPSDRLLLSSSYARTHQFTQSLRNPESVVGTLFPADLPVGAGAPGVPVARSDQGVFAVEYSPSAGVRVGVQAYERALDGLLLVAPVDGEPFATGPFTVGTAAARGASADVAVTAARFGVTASYAVQRVRFGAGGSTYVPEHGARHLLEGGVILFPTTTTALRIGAVAALGRRTTSIANGFEWESCNLLDQGCEFGGSPNHTGQQLGGTAPPAYLRVDVGFRQHFHVTLGGRDAQLALFGSLTNVFNRRNVLTYARDPVTGQGAPVEMRPPSPLVVGLDWRF